MRRRKVYSIEQRNLIKVLVVGEPDEKAYASLVVDGVDDSPCLNMARKTNIDGLISLIAHANIMVSNDVGPMRICFCT